jgi:phosphate transport system protein
MYRDVLDNELLEVKQSLLEMGGMTGSALRRSVALLKSRDLAGAQELVADDEIINAKQMEIEEACLKIIATQQPVASDLRIIFSVLAIATEIERMADYAKGIARISLKIGEKPLVKPLTTIPVMADRLCQMLDEALAAFTTASTEKAREVAEKDQLIDDFHNQTHRELLTFIMEDPRLLTGALYLTWVSHNLERTGDRIVNICERIIFAATGEFADL